MPSRNAFSSTNFTIKMPKAVARLHPALRRPNIWSEAVADSEMSMLWSPCNCKFDFIYGVWNFRNNDIKTFQRHNIRFFRYTSTKTSTNDKNLLPKITNKISSFQWIFQISQFFTSSHPQASLSRFDLVVAVRMISLPFIRASFNNNTELIFLTWK